MNEFIPVEDFISELLSDIGGNRDYLRSSFRRWIYNAVAEIDYYVTNIEETEKIRLNEDLEVRLPDNLVAIRKVLLHDGCIHPIYDDTIICCFEPRDKCCAEYKVTRKKRCLHFSSNVLPRFNSVQIQYYAAPVNDKGEPLVPTKYIEAITAYVDWKYLRLQRRKHQNSTPSKSNVVALSEMQMAHMHWKEQHDKAQANITTPRNFEKLKQSAERYLMSTNSFPASLGKCFQTYWRSRP